MPIPITMPALSPTMEEGTLAAWLVKEGDHVSPGDVIAEIETDKATMEVEAVDEGTVGKILIPAGTEGVKVNETIALLLEEGEDASALNGGGAAKPAPAPQPQTVARESQAAPSRTDEPARLAKDGRALPPSSDNGHISVSPLARRLAEQAGLDLAGMAGSGPGGRIVKADVEAALAGKVQEAPQPAAERPAAARREPEARPTAEAEPAKVPMIAPGKDMAALGIEPGSYDEYPHDGMRKTIARRLTQSTQSIPHYYLTIDCEIDALMKMRRDLNARSPEGEDAYKISVNDFVIRASALALMKVPGCNASWTDKAILRHHHADIGVAVALDGGLITPIVRQAEAKGLATIAREMKEMAERARNRRLMPEEYTGGTFSVSNLGMFGVRNFTGVINPPHAMLLAVGAGERRPVVHDGQVAVATVMTVTLSCDHRVVDGALGAEWLKVFKAYIEDPVTMML